MKKLLMGMLIMLIGLLGFCEGVQEGEQEIRTIVFGSEGVDWGPPVPDDPWFGGKWLGDNLIPKFEAETGIRVEFRVWGDHAIEQMDAELASNDPPDVIIAYAARISRLRKYGVDLYDYMPKPFLAGFIPEFFEPWIYDGKLFALPHVGWSIAYSVDKTVAEQIGADHLLPADDSADRSWTFEQFNEFLRLCKANGIYGTYLFANGHAGDYWSSYGFLAGFGAKLYSDGKIAINTPEGLAAVKYLKWLQTDGHVPSEVAAYSYKEFIDSWMRNDMASCGANLPFITKPGYKSAGFDQGLTDSAHDCVMMEWPHVEGMDHTPLMYGPDAVIVIDNGDEQKIKDACLFAQYLSSPETHLARAETAKWSPLWAYKGRGNETAEYLLFSKVIKQAGVWDMGVGFEQNSDLRGLWATTLQYLFNDKKTPQECLEYFEKEGSKLLD